MNGLSTTVTFEAYPKVSIQEFIPELAFEFTDMPEDAFSHFILKAINKLARDGNVLRRTAIIKTQHCVESYLLEPLDCMDIVAIMSVCKTTGGCGFYPVTRLTMEPCQLPWGAYTWFEYPNVIHFSPVGHHDTYKVTMSVAPTYDACEVDEILLTRYLSVILDGAKSDLYNMASKPWSSQQRAADCERRFLLGIRQAAIDTMAGYQRGGIRAKRMRVL